MALTDNQRRFVDAKVRGASNKDAAEAAGYAAATASAAGSRLAKNPDILAELERRSRVKGRARKAQAEPPVDDPPADEQEGDEDNGEQLANLPHTNDPLTWLLALMNESKAKVFDRRNAAQAALPYIHGKKADQGKKEQKGAAAKEASKGRYAARPAPKLAVDNTKG